MFTNQLINSVAILGSILEVKKEQHQNDPFEGFRINQFISPSSRTEPLEWIARLTRNCDPVKKTFLITPSIASTQKCPSNHC